MKTTDDSICVIEKWQKVEPYKKIETLSPAFSDINYAIHQVESIVLNHIKELESDKVLNQEQFKTAVSSIPTNWMDVTDYKGNIFEEEEDEFASVDSHILMHKHPDTPFVYVVTHIPLLKENFNEVKHQ